MTCVAPDPSPHPDSRSDPDSVSHAAHRPGSGYLSDSGYRPAPWSTPTAPPAPVPAPVPRPWDFDAGSIEDQEQSLIGARGFLAALSVDTLTGPQADRLLRFYTKMERLGAAGKLLVAAKVQDTCVWRQEGYRSAAAFLADKTGTTVGDAVAVIETARQLGRLPDTATCLRRGDFSPEQVREVAAAATVHPAAEQELLEIAARGSLKSLRERCRQVKALASWETDEVGRYNAIRRGRYLRHHTDVEGALCLQARLTPDEGARLIEAVRAKAGVFSDAARAAGVSESSSAYAADGLVSLADDAVLGTGTGIGRPTVVLRVDAAALRRGETEHGEVCEIPGVGPVPLATATRLLGDAVVKVVVRNGVEVASVCHLGRTVPAHLATALAERDRTCVVPRCDATDRLETHHRVAVIDGGPTSLANLVRLCKWHHDLLTYEGFTLTGAAGDWRWHPPPPSDRGPLLE